MFRTLVVPLDGSSLAERAVPYAVRLAQSACGRLILMRAVLAPAPRSLDGTDWAGEQADAIAEAEQYLREMADSIAGQIPVETFAPYGRAAVQILETARAFRADGVVMATHGRTGLPHLLFGSVTESVLANCIVPVFVVRAQPAQQAAPSFAPYAARILVPQDGSASDAAALQAAIQIGGLRGELILVNPPVGITQAAAEYRADLIVMAAHGRTGFRRGIVSSVAKTVLRTGSTPVLLVHPHLSGASRATEQLAPAMHA